MDIASIIDHTVLKADCTFQDIKQLCEEAKTYQFAAVCVPPFYVKHAHKILVNTRIRIATVVGFPMGYSTIPAKVEEIKRAINDGADELDVVVNIAAIKNTNWNYVKNDIETATRIAQMRGKSIKIIFETALLSLEEIERLCEICAISEVNYIKTSTGFHGQGATPEIVRFMRKYAPPSIKIKASGGIRTYEAAIELIAAGADRLGCSASIAIVNGQTGRTLL